MGDEIQETASDGQRRQRLRFKVHKESVRSRRRSTTSRSPRSRRPDALNTSDRYHRTQLQDVLDPDDEAFYCSGAAYSTEPSLATNYDPDDFTERLFDAMADDEGRDYWQSVYHQPIHDFPAQKDMTDDQYATFVRRGMWERTHKEKADAQRRQSRGSKDQEQRESRKTQQSDGDHMRKTNARLQETLERRWRTYLEDWEKLGQTAWSMRSVPWPVATGSYKDINPESVAQFLSFAGPVKALAKEELRRRWHPDRFQQRAEKHVTKSDQVVVLKAVTLISQILNNILSREA